MLNVYDHEKKKIEEVGADLQRKWNFLARRLDDNIYSNKNRKLIELWHQECMNKFKEAGFNVTVDVTPALANVSPPTITIESRTQPHVFDHERQAYEIKTGKK